MRIDAKRAFVLADWMKSARRCESEEEFVVLLDTEQKRVAQLTEEQVDQIVTRDESRLRRFRELEWDFRRVTLGECQVYPRMGKRAWAVGRVSDVSSAFTQMEPTASRIWKMKLFASLFLRLPLIILQKGQTMEVDDGSHRAIAMYLSGIREAPAYVGAHESKT